MTDVLALDQLGPRALAAPRVDVVREVLAGTPAWLVGGAMRDIALGREVNDLDVAVLGPPEEPARAIARELGGVAFELSDEFPAWRVKDREDAWQVDLAELRAGTIGQDLALRDFTVGAIAADLSSGGVLDPLGGLEDLKAGVIRACGPTSFSDDPLRLMRAARLVSQFGWKINEETVTLARQESPRAGEPAGERTLAELLLLVGGRNPLEGFAAMDRLGLFDWLLPEIGDLHDVVQGPNHHLDVYGHTMEVVEGVLRIESDLERFTGDRAPEVSEYLARPLGDGATRGTALRLGALFHDCAKPQTRSEDGGFISFRGHDRIGAEQIERRFRELRASRKLIGYMADLTRHHLILGFLVTSRPLDRRQIFQYLDHTDPVSLDVTLLTVADRMAARGSASIASEEMVQGHMELAMEMVGHALDWDRNGPPAQFLPGNELAEALGIDTGPRIGEVMKELSAARFAGEINDANEAVVHARRFLEAG
ncbi:MAG: HD domain-containing protein [Solirubrobacterales bacterium]|jgi:tRNA nucleotidyltransferase/poly(A) polymerase|nr:HD domain-containing protein [Solirubrobacterales bacterium]